MSTSRGPAAHLRARPEDDMEGMERPPSRKLRKLLPFFAPYRGRALLTVLLMLVVTATGLAGPALAQVAIDHGIRAGDEGTLVAAVVLFLAAGGVGLVAGYWQSYLSSWVGERVLLDLRTALFRHMMRLELGYHERVPTGRSVSRLTSDIEALDSLVTEGATSLIINGLTFVGVVAILFAYDWQLALMAFAIFPLLAVGTGAFRVTSARAYRRTREKVAEVMSVLQETLSGMKVVQGYGRQKPAREAFRRANDEYREANMQTVRLSGLYFPGIELLSGIGLLLILWFGSNRVLDGDISIGVMVAFIGYLSSFFDPIQQLSQLYSTFQSAMAALEKVLGVLETEPTLGDAPDAVELPPMRGAIDLTGVTFGYRPDRPVIHDVDLHIGAGETVALVGATGAGKSTLAKLIARFYDPTDGTVAIDGHDLRTVTQASLRDQLAIVPQEGHLFAGTLRENLAFGCPGDITDARLVSALEAVGGDELLAGLPEGLDTEVTERGSGLSAGQRQLVAFARALAADPRLLILDEATSSVDVRTEQRIEQAMEALLPGRTAVLIAHRLSTIRRADRIVVLDQGRIVEQGSHEELMDLGGRYAGLYGDWEQATTGWAAGTA
ncbi:MAG: ABC transporter ATP-binding protein [Thermoleophilia bacterium]|nr:ABC transporter ATP-binding protein [Thermoleophilia bacterium]